MPRFFLRALSDFVLASKVGFLYFLITFVIAFALGVVRVLVVAPVVGESIAVVIEVPLMIFISWRVSAWVMLRYFYDRSVKDYLMVGVTAFLFLMAAEYMLAVLAFGRTSEEFLLSLQTAPGLIGLLGQMGFAVIPAIQQKLKDKTVR